MKSITRSVCSVLIALAGLTSGCDHGPSDGSAEADAISGPRVCATGSTIQGVDVSKYQGSIDWGQVAQNGIAFAFVRVSDGANSVDSRFADNWSGTLNANIPRGAYQFFRASQDPDDQADLLIKTLQQQGLGELPPVMDIEITDGQSNDTVRSNAVEWLERVAQAVGVRPIVYLPPAMAPVLQNALAEYPLWIANYGASCPRVPTAWNSWSFWQNNEKGSVPGINGDVDTDLFNGTMDDLMAAARPPNAGSTKTCHSATLSAAAGKDVEVPLLTCVQDSDLNWYQCTDIGWVQGVSDNNVGTAGPCGTVYPFGSM
jgi:lysozyme